VPVATRLCLLGCGLLAVLILSSCGDGDGETVAGTGAGHSAPDKPGGAGAPPTATRLCQGQIGGFVGSMDSLRRRLVVGLAYEQYVDEVEGVRAAYRRIPTAELRVECLTEVGAPAEKAFNRYIDAGNAWGECVGEPGCESATVEPVLQQGWRVAARFLSQAHRGLADLSARLISAAAQDAARNEQGPPEGDPCQVLVNERGNSGRVGQRPVSLCPPVPGVDSAGPSSTA
jgi:hypothetical protein